MDTPLIAEWNRVAVAADDTSDRIARRERIRLIHPADTTTRITAVLDRGLAFLLTRLVVVDDRVRGERADPDPRGDGYRHHGQGQGQYRIE